jgi:phenylpropionate dioxygenase-like ring-hydroxylating dioxygenase large terminal subunit
MRPSIQPQAYLTGAAFETECATVLRRHWHLAGSAAQLANSNDYICLDIADKSIIVQNIDGVLRAFLNVCSHRFSRMFESGCGNALLRCPYHGWVYNGEGLPFGIPKRPRFDEISNDTLPNYRLQQWKVERLGDLVFVSEAPAQNLRESLGDLYGLASSMSLAVGHLIETNRMRIKANWKVTIENTLESYHVGYIHPETFNKMGLHGTDFEFSGPHSSWSSSVSQMNFSKWSRIAKSFEHRPWKSDGYMHLHVFPTTTLATTYGATFSVQSFLPVSPNETEFCSYVFATKLLDPSGADRNSAITVGFGASAAEFNRAVFEEDRKICEMVQKGVAHAHGFGALSDEEYRVLHFHRNYNQQINSEFSRRGA